MGVALCVPHGMAAAWTCGREWSGDKIGHAACPQAWNALQRTARPGARWEGWWACSFPLGSFEGFPMTDRHPSRFSLQHQANYNGREWEPFKDNEGI